MPPDYAVWQPLYLQMCGPTLSQPVGVGTGPGNLTFFGDYSVATFGAFGVSAVCVVEPKGNGDVKVSYTQSDGGWLSEVFYPYGGPFGGGANWYGAGPNRDAPAVFMYFVDDSHDYSAAGGGTTRPSDPGTTRPTTREGSDYAISDLYKGAKAEMKTRLTKLGVEGMHAFDRGPTAFGELQIDTVAEKLRSVTESFGVSSAHEDAEHDDGLHIAGTTYNAALKSALSIPYNLKGDYGGLVRWVRLAGTLYVAVFAGSEITTALAWGLGMREAVMVARFWEWCGSWLPWNSDDDGEGAAPQKNEIAELLGKVQGDAVAERHVLGGISYEDLVAMGAVPTLRDDEIEDILYDEAGGPRTTPPGMGEHADLSDDEGEG